MEVFAKRDMNQEPVLNTSRGEENATLPITIIEAEEKHINQILDIYNHYIAHSTATFHLEPETLEEYTALWQHTIQHQQLPFLVAIRGNSGSEQVLGFSYVRDYRPRPAYAATVECTVYVSPSATGQGVGRVLLRDLLARLKEIPISHRRPHGVREVLSVMAVDPLHLMNLPRFYASEGFVAVGTIRNAGWKFGRWIDVAIMQLSLVK